MSNKVSRILVVDDSATMRKLIIAMLASLGFDRVDQASDGGSALNFALSQRYTLILSDWHMQPMDGLELFRQIKRRPTLSTVPLVLMTADACKASNIAREHGVFFLRKPFTKATLTAKLLAVHGIGDHANRTAS